MESFAKILSVAVGGATGAVARHLINVSALGNLFAKFPFHTFFINVTGSFLIGFLFIIFSEKFTESENLRLLTTVGFLGAFTTFSTFELEIFGLVRERYFLNAFFYFFTSVLLGFVGVAGGVWLGRKFV